MKRLLLGVAAALLVAASLAPGHAAPTDPAAHPAPKNPSLDNPGLDNPGQSSPSPSYAEVCGGAQPLKEDGSAWSCTFSDEFDGTELDRTKWQVVTGTPTGDPTNACYRDSPENVDVADGSLNLTVRALPLPESCPGQGLSSYTSGWVATTGDVDPATGQLDDARFSQRYGRFEARMRVQQAEGGATRNGLQEAFWLFPDLARLPEDDTYGTDGRHEIDVVETYSQFPHHAIPYLHYPGDVYDLGAHTSWGCNWVSRGDWHTYTLEWGPDRIEILVDGRTCLVNTSGHPAFDKAYVVAFTQLLGQGANSYLPALGPNLPATMNVDYVRVWE